MKLEEFDEATLEEMAQKEIMGETPTAHRLATQIGGCLERVKHRKWFKLFVMHHIAEEIMEMRPDARGKPGQRRAGEVAK